MRGSEEDSDPEEALDDWFIESLKTYKDLHVYQLEHPTRVLEWTSGKSLSVKLLIMFKSLSLICDHYWFIHSWTAVCVAGYSASSKNEILELSLPLRLLAEQNKGLCAHLKHIPGTRCAVSNDGASGSLQIWDLGGDDTAGRRLAAPLAPASEPRVLHGATTDDVQLTDISTGRELYRLESEPLSCLQFLGDGAFACGSVNGSVLVADSRSSAAPVRHAAPAAARSSEHTEWSVAFHRSAVVRSSVSGQTVVSDLRRMDTCAAQALVEVDAGKHRGSLNVSWAPALEHYIALSGSSGLVQIFDTSLWGRSHTVSSPEDDAIVTSHTWHPERPRTLLSAASDASVHVWDWNSQSERRE
uniref:WD repeat-containing protein 73 n=1 Tax=Neogobius melanostomus TaxID=47308 RepID=A0A8C6T401_9GOBI